MNTQFITVSKALLGIVLLGIALPASAEREEGRHGGERSAWHEHERGERGEWHGGEMRHFEREDAHLWRGGRWVHDWHDGRMGWWWLAGGAWYFYPQPVYPYPDPYTPAVVIQQPAAPVVVAPQTTAQVWYYCAASKGYYPYVATCPSGWQTVAPTPPATPDVPPDLPAQSR